MVWGLLQWTYAIHATSTVSLNTTQIISCNHTDRPFYWESTFQKYCLCETFSHKVSHSEGMFSIMCPGCSAIRRFIYCTFSESVQATIPEGLWGDLMVLQSFKWYWRVFFKIHIQVLEVLYLSYFCTLSWIFAMKRWSRRILNKHDRKIRMELGSRLLYLWHTDNTVSLQSLEFAQAIVAP